MSSGARGAVDPEGGHAGEVRDGHDGGHRVRTQQHPPVAVEGHLHEQRNLAPRLGHGVPGRKDRDLGLQRVLAGFDLHEVHAAFQEARDLVAIAREHLVVGDLPQRRKARPRAHRTRHEPGAIGHRDLVGGLPGQVRGHAGQFAGAGFLSVLAKDDRVGAEGIGFDDIRAGREVGPVDVQDHVGTGHDEDLVEALVAVEVRSRQVSGLDLGPHGAVKHHGPSQGQAQDGMVHRLRPLSTDSPHAVAVR